MKTFKNLREELNNIEENRQKPRLRGTHDPYDKTRINQNIRPRERDFERQISQNPKFHDDNIIKQIEAIEKYRRRYKNDPKKLNDLSNYLKGVLSGDKNVIEELEEPSEKKLDNYKREEDKKRLNQDQQLR